jgi:hypothetical protein
MKLSVTSLSIIVSILLLISGILASVAAFSGWLYPVLSVSLITVGMAMIETARLAVSKFHILSLSEKVLLLFLGCIWLIHACGVLVPETGFDAVWYHLPVAHHIAENQQLVYLPELYQSLNPLFSDLIFVLGYQVVGELGTKIVAFLFGMTLILVTYSLARLFLSRYWALWVVLIVSTIQVIAWQSSSFYVDIAKAVWELSALTLVLRLDRNKITSIKKWLIIGLFLGASVATKAFSLLLVPLFVTLLLVVQTSHRIKACLALLAGTLLVALPFYLRTWWYTGNSFLSLSLHVQKLEEIGGESQLVLYLVNRILTLPTSLLTLTVGVADYVSIVLLVLAPITYWYVWQNRSETKVLMILGFGLYQWLIWWLVPPLSTRYALSGFVVLLLLTLMSAEYLSQSKPRYMLPLLLVLILSVAINIAPRLYVLKRTATYLLGQQTKAEYLQQFKDGSIDHHLEKWHQLTSS